MRALDGKEKFLEHFNVSRETIERLEIYEELIRKWNSAINLVAASTVDQIWDRHFLESVQAYDFADANSGKWLDLGSGGGFPGAVVAILAAEADSTIRMTCIESDIRKCEFLRTVSRSTGIPMQVVSRRIEETPPQEASIISARALSSLGKLLQFADRHVAPAGQAVFLKGESWPQEVDNARNDWTFDLETCPSLTNPTSALLKLRNIKRA